MSRPRPLEIKNSEEFIVYREKAWQILKDEVVRVRQTMFQAN